MLEVLYGRARTEPIDERLRGTVVVAATDEQPFVCDPTRNAFHRLPSKKTTSEQLSNNQHLYHHLFCNTSDPMKTDGGDRTPVCPLPRDRWLESPQVRLRLHTRGPPPHPDHTTIPQALVGTRIARSLSVPECSRLIIPAAERVPVVGPIIYDARIVTKDIIKESTRCIPSTRPSEAHRLQMCAHDKGQSSVAGKTVDGARENKNKIRKETVRELLLLPLPPLLQMVRPTRGNAEMNATDSNSYHQKCISTPRLPRPPLPSKPSPLVLGVYNSRVESRQALHDHDHHRTLETRLQRDHHRQEADTYPPSSALGLSVRVVITRRPHSRPSSRIRLRLTTAANLGSRAKGARRLSEGPTHQTYKAINTTNTRRAPTPATKHPPHEHGKNKRRPRVTDPRPSGKQCGDIGEWGSSHPRATRVHLRCTPAALAVITHRTRHHQHSTPTRQHQQQHRVTARG